MQPDTGLTAVGAGRCSLPLLVLIEQHSIPPVLIDFLQYKGLGAEAKTAVLLLATVAIRIMHRDILQLIERGNALL